MPCGRELWTQRFAALLMSVIVGAAAALMSPAAMVEPVDAHLNPWGHTWPYSFNSSNCGWNTEVDPIQIVYYRNASTYNVQHHSAHHGGWDVDDGSIGTQYFYDHFCGPMDGQNATERFDYWPARYHQRHWWNDDPDFGTYSLATPHYEDLLWCGHAVRENESASMPEGGFIHAKHKIDGLWHNWNQGGGAHWWGGYQEWDNTRWFKQCDDQYAWSNGTVDFIRID